MRRLQRIWVSKHVTLHRRYGLGVYFEAGCTGSTYGEEGDNYGATLTLVLFAWTLDFRVTWKEL